MYSWYPQLTDINPMSMNDLTQEWDEREFSGIFHLRGLGCDLSPFPQLELNLQEGSPL